MDVVAVLCCHTVQCISAAVEAGEFFIHNRFAYSPTLVIPQPKMNPSRCFRTGLRAMSMPVNSARLISSDVGLSKYKMATTAIQRAPGLPQPRFNPIIERVTSLPHNKDAVPFEPKKHLAFTPPSRVIQMKDIGYADDLGVSPVAVSEPFQLFSPEAIQHMRREIMSPEVMENCKYSSNIAACQLRGYAPK
jgi:hypothetical protein